MRDGLFTEESRNILRKRRNLLGLTARSAASFFNVDVSTYRKWETGEIKRCSRKFRKKVNDYLRTGVIWEKNSLSAVEEPDNPVLVESLDTVSKVFAIIKSDSAAVDFFLSELDEALRTAMNSYFKFAER